LGVVLVEHRQPAVHPHPTVAAETPLTIPAMAPPVAPAITRVSQKPSRKRRVEDDRPFIEIPYTVPLAPEERTTVVRMQVTVAALIAIGFSLPDYDPAALVEVDVLVSQDGRARAIRPVVVSK
jgi:hypothetical protein